MVYKWCAVPKCTSTTIKTPDKLFVSVPKNVKMRRKWLQLSRRNPDDVKANSNLFFCEDHFDMEKDMVNFYQYKMGLSQRIIMVNEVLPSKFNCQQDRNKRISDADTSRSAFVKRQRMRLIEECDDNQQPSTSTNRPTDSVANIFIEKELRLPSDQEQNITMEVYKKNDKSTSTEPIVTAEKSVQFNYVNKVDIRSKAVQTKIQTRDKFVSPYRNLTISCGTSPFKIEPCPHRVKPSKTVSINKRIGFMEEERSDSDVSVFKEKPLQQDSSSFGATSSKVSDSSTSIACTNEDVDKMQRLQTTLRLIVNKPMMYVGIPKQCYFIVHLIHKHTHIPYEHILMCLKK